MSIARLEAIFDTLIDSFVEKGVGIAKDFLDPILASGLKDNLLSLYSENRLKAAGTGNGSAPAMNASVRGDKICWLDRHNNDASENRFFDLMDRFVGHLNRTCFTGITDYEFHYTLYEPGRFYKKHIDQFKNNPSRQFSMITYLNEDWEEKDGGELCVYQGNIVERILPENGKSVFFKSDQWPHEVLPSLRPRLSITGWLKRV